MNELQQLKQLVAEINERIQVLENKPAKQRRWVPAPDDEYWMITYCYEPVLCTHTQHAVDQKSIETGNFYKTEKEAMKAAKKKYELDKLKYEIKCWIEDNDPVELDWTNHKTTKYQPEYCHREKKWKICVISTSMIQNPSSPAVSSRDLAEQYIETFKDRLHLLLEEWS